MNSIFLIPEKNFTLADLSRLFQIPEENLDLVVLGGSRLYGTAEKDSDYDFKIVGRFDCNSRCLQKNYHGIEIDCLLQKTDDFVSSLESGNIMAWEFISAPTQFVYLNRIYPNKKTWPVLEKKQVIQSALQKSEEDWNSASQWAERCLADGENFPVGLLKKFWHSCRILNFGTQMATARKIVLFSALNIMYQEILTYPNPEKNFPDCLRFLEKERNYCQRVFAELLK